VAGLAPAEADDRPPHDPARLVAPEALPPIRSAPLPLDRHSVPLAPGYVRPPAGSVPLPSSGGPLIFPSAPSAGTDRVWIPSRLEPVVTVGGQGRIIYTQDYIPGRFAQEGLRVNPVRP
jgi:hypothetical protein